MLGRHQHPGLLADVVAEPDHVDSHPHEPLGRDQVIAVGDLEDLLGQVGALHEVHR